LAVEAGASLDVGGLALCEAGGWADVRRILRRDPSGGYLTALDPLPGGRELVPASRILGVVTGCPAASGPVGRAIAVAFPLWSRLAALGYWMQKIRTVPDFSEAGADLSVQEKYDQQIESYLAIEESPGDVQEVGVIRRRLPPAGSILVCGCGTGREAIGLARRGYRVSGVDVLPRMVEISRERARAAGLEIEFFAADLTTMDLPGKKFDVAYLTPLVYSFVQGRWRRVEALRRIGRLLAPEGSVMFTAHVMSRFSEILRALVVWVRRGVSGRTESEFGDWYTWFLTPQGEIGRSFGHRFLSQRAVLAEVRDAGFRSVRREPEGHFTSWNLR
jgi:SAM-dependent methyltransferase